MAYVFALLASVSFALSIQFQGIGAKGLSGVRAAYFSVVTMTALFWIASPFLIDWSWWLSPAVLIYMMSGLLVPSLGQFAQIMSVQRVGPNVTSSISPFFSVFAILPAILFLGETLNIQGWAGLALLITGLVLASWSKPGQAREWPLIFIAFPILAAMARGFSQPLNKFGFTILSEPFFASLVMATTSTVVLIIILKVQHATVPPLSELWGRKYMVLSGALNGLGILSVQAAIWYGDVSSVAPLIGTTPLWVWLLSTLVFRQQKSTWKHLAMAVFVVAGGTLIILR